MTDQKRAEIILKEIELAKSELVKEPRLLGFGAQSDIFKLSDGRDAQIKIEVTVDEDEIDEPTRSFKE